MQEPQKFKTKPTLTLRELALLILTLPEAEQNQGAEIFHDDCLFHATLDNGQFSGSNGQHSLIGHMLVYQTSEEMASCGLTEADIVGESPLQAAEPEPLIPFKAGAVAPLAPPKTPQPYVVSCGLRIGDRVIPTSAKVLADSEKDAVQYFLEENCIHGDRAERFAEDGHPYCPEFEVDKWGDVRFLDERHPQVYDQKSIWDTYYEGLYEHISVRSDA